MHRLKSDSSRKRKGKIYSSKLVLDVFRCLKWRWMDQIRDQFEMGYACKIDRQPGTMYSNLLPIGDIQHSTPFYCIFVPFSNLYAVPINELIHCRDIWFNLIAKFHFEAAPRFQIVLFLSEKRNKKIDLKKYNFFLSILNMKLLCYDFIFKCVPATWVMILFFPVYTKIIIHLQLVRHLICWSIIWMDVDI